MAFRGQMNAMYCIPIEGRDGKCDAMLIVYRQGMMKRLWDILGTRYGIIQMVEKSFVSGECVLLAAIIAYQGNVGVESKVP